MEKHRSRIVKKDNFHLQSSILDDTDTALAVSTMLDIFESSLGPNGRCKLIHNGLGGHVSVTSSSARLIQGMQVSNPALKLVVSSTQRHLASFSDCGLMSATLALLIIKHVLPLDVNRHVVVEILDCVTRNAIQYLNSDKCASTVNIGLDRLGDLLSLVSSVTLPKPGCCVSKTDIQHINRCIVKAFLKSIPSVEDFSSIRSEDSTQYLCIEGMLTKDSRVLDGLLIECSSIPTYRQKPLCIKFVQSGPNAGLISVALFNISLAGECNNSLGAKFDMLTALNIDDAIMEQMLKLASELVRCGIGVVVCQKVVHPKLKRYLQRQSVLVFDRLGLVQIKLLQNITGGAFFSSCAEVLNEGKFGYVQGVSHLVINNRSYLHYVSIPEHSKVCTVILYGPTEESLAELKYVCTVAHDVLWQVMKSRLALRGGGYWQHDLACHLNQLSDTIIDEWCETIECSSMQVRSVVKIVEKAFKKIHRIICNECIEDCLYAGNSNNVAGSKEDCTVLDAFVPAVEAVSSAMFVASMVLGIKHYIRE